MRIPKRCANNFSQEVEKFRSCIKYRYMIIDRLIFSKYYGNPFILILRSKVSSGPCSSFLYIILPHHPSLPSFLAIIPRRYLYILFKDRAALRRSLIWRLGQSFTKPLPLSQFSGQSWRLAFVIWSRLWPILMTDWRVDICHSFAIEPLLANLMIY